MMDSQNGFQFEYLQEEIASLRKAKAEEARVKELLGASVREAKSQVARLGNDSRMVAEEIMSSLRSTLESMRENHYVGAEQHG